MVVHTTYFTIIRDTNEQCPSGSISKRAQLPADVGSTGPFELKGKPFTQADEDIQMFFIHKRILAQMINAIFTIVFLPDFLLTA